MAEPIVKLNQVVMPGFPDAAPFSWELSKGDVWLLLGENKAGKSTLTRLVLGLISPLSGSVSLFGKKLSGLRQNGLFNLRQRASAVLDKDGLVNSWTVYDNIVLPLRYRGDMDSADRRVQEVVSEYQLPRDWLSAPVTALGYEQRRMIALVRALITKPELLVFDGLSRNVLGAANWDGGFEMLRQSIAGGCSLILVPLAGDPPVFDGLPVFMARLTAGRLVSEESTHQPDSDPGFQSREGWQD